MSNESCNLAELALAVALPLEEEDFQARTLTSDWLKKYQMIRTGWRDYYQPEVFGPVSKMIAFAEDHGATVCRRAGLAEIRDLSASKKVVILFAHWKGPKASNDDIVSGKSVQDFIDRATSDESSLAVWIANRLRVGTSLNVAEVLNESLDCVLPINASADGVIVLEDEITRQTARREALDVLFEGLLHPGNRLELWDGLHEKREVAGAISPEFNGVLDLTACNSMVLGRYLSGCFEHRFHTIELPETVVFLWAAPIIQGTLSLMVTGGFDYQEARKAATEIMDAEIRRASRWSIGRILKWRI